MKKSIMIIVLLATAAFLSGCSIYEGYAGSEGAMLKQYLEPAGLKELVDNPRADIWIIDVRAGGDHYRTGCL